MIASFADIVEQERSAGQSDNAIAALLSRSRVKPPPGFHRWSPVAVRAAVHEDPSGFRLSDGKHR